MSPALPHPKHVKRPISSRTLNDGDFSAWNGHSPTQFRPVRFSATYGDTTSTRDTPARTRSMSSSTIAIAAEGSGRVCQRREATGPAAVT